MAASLLTLIVARLAHWYGLQPYSDDNTSKSNLVGFFTFQSTARPHGIFSLAYQLLALLTCGEGNHNFVSPHSGLCLTCFSRG